MRFLNRRYFCCLYDQIEGDSQIDDISVALCLLALSNLMHRDIEVRYVVSFRIDDLCGTFITKTTKFRMILKCTIILRNSFIKVLMEQDARVISNRQLFALSRVFVAYVVT